MNVDVFEKAARSLPAQCFSSPLDVAMVLGSGWGDALRWDRVVARVGYAGIEGFGAATVSGHVGELIVYEYAGLRVAAWCGRRHFYEGVDWEAVVLPVELSRRMGAKRLLLTNASGGINPALKAGDFVIIKDHINTVGINPFIGPHNPDWGPRFPDMSEIYTKRLRDVLHETADRLGLRTMEGVYAFTSGPVYETPAEVQGYKHAGADLVGMSTVPEAVFAAACGMEVAGVSLVSNLAAGIARTPLKHEEVMAAAKAAKPVMAEIVDGFLKSKGAQ